MKTHFLVRFIVLAGIAVTTGLVITDSVGAATEIKVALVTPEGSAWTNALYRMAATVEKRSGGEIRFKVYAGGVSGDETDVLRKMRANRIHAAGFSGVGMGVILPQVRILEAPLLYRNYEEIDRVKQALQPAFEAELEKNGYILLGFAEAGFVRFFSSESMNGPEGFGRLKMWVWKDDPVAKSSLEAFGIKTYPLNITDVNTGLETGMINAFYSPPLAAIAFQWFAKVKYMLDYPMVNSTGAFVIKASAFNRLSSQNQQLLREEAAEFCNELIRQARLQNQEALQVLREAGITFETPSRKRVARFEENARQVYDDSIGRLYSKALFEQVNAILGDLRSAN